ncbi:DUF6087 family protein [Streptomyces sp. NBC_01310]|uniref:DUF6087 family protein n=1 Tax=Streptomyces sp. NBC_01310 TaxID=2903820 RepID=UPI0035B653B5|nr:DUF6087 family protein [Streptomyces sp. NBC_01310]
MLLAVSEEEPLEAWAKRYLDRRAARIGELRAVPIGGNNGRGAHIDPRAPRVMMRWDGYQWVAESVAADYAAAQRILHGIGTAQAEPPTGLPGQALPKPTGRHRRTPPS